jgi:hypothetical protein
MSTRIVEEFITFVTQDIIINCEYQGRIQDFVLGGTKVGEGSGISLHRVQSVRTCSEYVNTRRDKEIRGVTAPDR